MVSWLGILVGVIFVWFAIKMGFYETWTMLFNIVISIYLAVFLSPVIADIVPMAGDTLYSDALTMIATAVVFFLILHGVSYVFITGQFNVTFPKVFDVLGTGFLGFLAGFLVASFVSFLICITPISQNSFVKSIGFGSQFQQTNVSVICWWCDLVNKVVSHQDSKYTTQEAISGLLKNVEKKRARAERVAPAEPNKPVEPNEPIGAVEPNNAEAAISGENQLDPPAGQD